MAMSIRKYIYASLALICLMCSCDPWLVPPVKITYEEDANGHKYVDLGLSVKWAAYDIGANSATELGHFFAWGETQPKKGYSWDTYKFAVPYKSPESGTRSFDNGYGKEYELTKYNLDPNSEYYDGKNTLDLIDDAAHMAWGGNWRMPTVSECNELVEKCEWTWTEYLGVYGYDVKGPNGNRMFWPYMEGRDMLYQDGTWLARWSSNCLNNNDNYYHPESWAYMMVGNGFGDAKRFLGLLVRAVYDKSLPKYSVLTFDANGGEGLMHPQQFNKGVSQSINAVRFTHESLNFAGWNTAPDGSGQSFANGQEITLDKNTTLYAQWALATGSENGYDYVDLGLPSGTKWAIYNVGATSPEGYGDYFAWGETAPKDAYSWENYKYGNHPFELTKYQTDYGAIGEVYIDDRMELEMIDDAAQANWGGNWRMPSLEEYEELFQYCSFTWASYNGVEGILVISELNQNRIFIPAAGDWYDNDLGSVGSDGSLWTRSKNSQSIYNFYFYRYSNESTRPYINIGNPVRYPGASVRPVFNEEIPPYYQVTFDANGGEGSMSSREYYQGQPKALPLCRYTHSASEFLAWNTAPDGSGTSYTDGQEITLTEDVTLYAQWFVFTPTYVDLGLSVKWATCNIGAITPEGYGDYFAWGETEPKSEYDWKTYIYCMGSEKTLTKYCNNPDYGYNAFTDDRHTLEPNDDAAHVNWGGEWRMPTASEMNELVNNCSWVWTQINGVNGQLGTSKINGITIFLPAGGECYSASLIFDMGKIGHYWQSNLNTTYYPNTANFLYLNKDDPWVWNSSRYVGYSIRAVCP